MYTQAFNLYNGKKSPFVHIKDSAARFDVTIKFAQRGNVLTIGSWASAEPGPPDPFASFRMEERFTLTLGFPHGGKTSAHADYYITYTPEKYKDGEIPEDVFRRHVEGIKEYLKEHHDELLAEVARITGHGQHDAAEKVLNGAAKAVSGTPWLRHLVTHPERNSVETIGHRLEQYRVPWTGADRLTDLASGVVNTAGRVVSAVGGLTALR